MATAFRCVNNTLTPDPKTSVTIASPTTARPNTAPHLPSYDDSSRMITDDATTPTRATFGGNALASQKPLPTSPFPEAVQIPESADKRIPRRGDSQHSRKSSHSEDMDMDDSEGEGEGAHGEDGAGSDDESMNADGSRSNKKKKSQRFYCTDYPPCNLSFTRSEHLARHIRKHTGERPFQCHCSRRFSRLDNLRQHAQTVHVNEDIPIDSLAATGTRFQRQIRTERVRQAGGRTRAPTAGSAGSTGRGHSKSLSTSSIASISSIGSNYSVHDEMRRRPPPIIMADPRSRMPMESYRHGPDAAPIVYRPASPSDFSTPTSATFSTGQGSPRWGSGVASPISSHSRAHSMYTPGTRTPGRRLSVPSGANPFQSPQRGQIGQAYFGPGAFNAPNAAVFSQSGGVLASPSTPTSTWSRRESMSSAADDPFRRRTWHPDSGRFAPVQYPTAGAPLPISNPAARQQGVRLPGIESFDPIPHRPLSPPRRNPSPMMIDSEAAHPPALLPAAEGGAEKRRGTAVWDMGLHRGLTRLDIASNRTPSRDGAGAWAHEANQAVQAQAEQARAAQHPTVRFEPEVQTVRAAPPPPPPPPPPSTNGHVRGHAHTVSAPSFCTPREMKRHGWYNGPSSAVPRGLAEETILERPGERIAPPPHVDRIVHPNVSAFAGFPAREQGHGAAQQPPNGAGNQPDSLKRLEALVAVATSEGSTATAY